MMLTTSSFQNRRYCSNFRESDSLIDSMDKIKMTTNIRNLNFLLLFSINRRISYSMMRMNLRILPLLG